MQNEYKDLRGGESLSPRQKDSIRARLRGFMDMHPARAPFSIRAYDAAAALSLPLLRARAVQFSAAALALVLIAGTGTAYAAGNALPGDALYSVKVNIEEPIQGAFAGASAEAQASWSAQLATRRLAEAETLAAQNKLTPQAVSAVASGLDQATAQFDSNVAQIATSSGDAAVAANLASNMEVTLAANTQVLAQLQSAVPSAAPTIAPLLSRVRSRTIAIDQTRAELTVAAAQNEASQGEQGTIRVAAAFVPASSSSAKASASENASTSVAAITSVQNAELNAKVAQLHSDIAAQLQSATGISLSTSTAPVVVAATSTPPTQVDATSTATSTTDDTVSPDVQEK